MRPVSPYAYIAVIGLLLAIGLVAFIFIVSEIVYEWKEFKQHADKS